MLCRVRVLVKNVSPLDAILSCDPHWLGAREQKSVDIEYLKAFSNLFHHQGHKLDRIRVAAAATVQSQNCLGAKLCRLQQRFN